MTITISNTLPQAVQDVNLVQLATKKKYQMLKTKNCRKSLNQNTSQKLPNKLQSTAFPRAVQRTNLWAKTKLHHQLQLQIQLHSLSG